MRRIAIDLFLTAVMTASGLHGLASARRAEPVRHLPALPPAAPPRLIAPIRAAAPALQIPQQQKEPDVDAMLVIDNSGSMFGGNCRDQRPAAGNDAEQRRITGAQIVIASLAADLNPRQTKLGIVSFGSEARLISPLEQLSNDDSAIRGKLDRAVREPPCEGDTNIVAALSLAQAELKSERHNPQNTPAIIFLTDGVPTQGGLEPEIRQLLGAMPDVRFYAILLGRSAQFTSFKRFWSDLADQQPNLRVYELTDNNGIENIYNNIKSDLDDGDEPLNMAQLAPGPTVKVPVPANVKQMVLSVLKPAPDLEVRLATAQGQDARELPPARFRYLNNQSIVDVFIVDRPESGDWAVSSPGGESLTVLQPQFQSLYEIQVIRPDARGQLAVEAQTTIEMQIVDSDTKAPLAGPFTIDSDYRQEGALLSSARPLTFGPGAKPHAFSAQVPAGSFADQSRYLFRFAAKDSVGLRSGSVEFVLVAGRTPAIVSATAPPKIYVDDAITVVVKTINGDSAEGAPTARVLPAGGAPIGLTTQTTNTLQAVISTFPRPGDYSLTVEYSGTTKAGQPFADRRMLTVSVVERASTIWLRRLAWLVAALILCFLALKYPLIGLTVPVLQRVGIAPRGYIAIIDTESPLASPSQSNLTELLKRRRRFRKLTIGPDGDIKVHPATADDGPTDADPAAPPKATLKERILGKRLAVISRTPFGDTYIALQGGGRTPFTKTARSVTLRQNGGRTTTDVEISAKPKDTPDSFDSAY